MIQSDTLSQQPDYGLDDEHDNEDIILLPDNLFINLLDVDLQKRITETKEMDYEVKETLDLLLKNRPTNLQKDLSDWKMEEIDRKTTLFYKGKNYIPKDQELRQDIVRMFHNHETAGHPGELETYNSVRQHYCWPGLRTFVKNYVQGCGICQQFKINRSPSNPAYQPIEGAKTTRPFANCSMDLITDLPLVNRLDSILVMVDQGLLKGVILMPCSKTLTADGAGQLLLDNLYK